ncbi:Cysteine desulfurase [Posidoniimonas corsicana]|uniref:Cysteine desulfurase n=1 Tax=Posidoniimonas corsicana TaxID=1938618 RepID=A0A5C5V9R6_9BACT|nr:aminotransferase class V-fold PLP-dependent enzyme [Posidoniimonas corsicana]TWT35356.1 Cysteine desulfurase [Posidoniimonas corsicana]
MGRPLDTDFVRAQFPAFSEASLQGWAFFENAGGSYACGRAVDRLRDYYTRNKVQPYGAYPASRTAGELMDEAYRRFAVLLNAGEHELHFGPSTSQNTYVLARAFESVLQPGDEVVVTNQDHEANSGVWRQLARTGCIIKEWRVDPSTGRLDVEELDDLLSDRTRLVTVPHCSNIVAEINPIAETVARCHGVGARVVVDGVAYAPHGLPDLGELGADVYLFSLYKTYGPHQGLMYVRDELLQELTPQCHYFNAGTPRKRMTPAGPDHAQISAAAGVADYIDAVYSHHFEAPSAAALVGRAVHDLFRDHERRLLTVQLDWLESRDDVRVLGPVDASRRAPTVSIIPLRRQPIEVLASLEQRKIMAGLGHFYAQRLLEAMGVSPAPGIVRLSFVHYTSREEIDQLIIALDEAL